jgi:hypothetical protein
MNDQELSLAGIWVQFAAAAMTRHTATDAAGVADQMIEKFKERYVYMPTTMDSIGGWQKK